MRSLLTMALFQTMKNVYPINKRTFLLIVNLHFFLFTFSVVAQDKGAIDISISSKKMRDRADHALKTGDLYTALFYYEEVVKKDSNNIPVRYKIAELYQLTRNYKSAAPAYDYVAKRASAVYPLASYYRSVMKKMLGKYKVAKEELEGFKKDNKNFGDKDFKKILNNEMVGCDSGIVYEDSPRAMLLENVGNSVNHPHTEFSPLQIDSTHLLFGSLREDTLKYYDIREDHKEPTPYRQIYEATKLNDQWADQGKFNTINDSTMEMGNFIYSSTSGRYYFTKCKKEETGKVDCKLYFTEKLNGKWSLAEMLPAPVNLKGYTSTQPAIALDTIKIKSKPVPKPAGKNNAKPQRKEAKPETATVTEQYEETLYFVSDRPEGKGETDIWSSTYNSLKKTWSPPVNIISVNTSQIECTPYFSKNNQTLYFSSNGHINAGGLDVFKIKKTGKKFINLENLAFPVNSAQDDLGYFLNEDEKSGYFVSNRVGGTPYFHETCCDDIYYFDYSRSPLFNHLLTLKIISSDTITCNGKILSYNNKNTSTGSDTIVTVVLKDCNYVLKLEKDHEYSFNYKLENFRHDTVIVKTPTVAKNTTMERELLLIPSITDTGTIASIPGKVSKIESEEKQKVVEEVIKDTTAIVPVVKDTIREKIPESVIVKPLDTLKHRGLDVIEGKSFILKGVEYATDSFNLTHEGKVAIDSLLIPLLVDRPEDVLIFGSHTDDHGSHVYNVKLSNKRAQKVTDYLIEKGIAKMRISGKGYGETQPMAPNKLPGGSDNPDGRRQNRRTEFMLLKP